MSNRTPPVQASDEPPVYLANIGANGPAPWSGCNASGSQASDEPMPWQKRYDLGASREAAMLAEIDDWHSLAATPRAEPVAWFEAEPSAKGWPLRDVIGGMIHSTRWHTHKPEVLNNALWPLYEHPAPQPSGNSGELAPRATADVEREPCAWTYDEGSDAWASACGDLWSFIDGGPEENSVKFCQGCGKPLATKGANP